MGGTYNRPDKPLLILLKPQQRILRIPRPLHNLPRHIRLLLPNPIIRNVIQNTPQLVIRGRTLGNFQLELGLLVFGVVGVVGGLVFGGCFGGGGGGLLKDCEGVGRGG